MKRVKIIAIALVCSVLLVQCAQKTLPMASVAAPTASTVPVDEAAELKKQYTPAQIAQGKVVFEDNCEKCHELRQPSELTVPLWDRILPKMSRKAKLTPDEAGIVRAWIITNAKAG